MSDDIIKSPCYSDIVDILSNEWKQWKDDVKKRKDDKNPGKFWLETIGDDNLMKSEIQLLDELKDFEKFDPYSFYYKGVSGYAVLSLKISLWALYHSFDEFKLNIPDWFKNDNSWPFKRFKFESIMWVVLIGADADTYGAIAVIFFIIMLKLTFSLGSSTCSLSSKDSRRTYNQLTFTQRNRKIVQFFLNIFEMF